MVGIADWVGESDRAECFFCQNWPEDAVLLMEDNNLQLNLETRIFRGHPKVNRKLPDGILPPWCVSVKDTHDSALQKMLGIVHIAKNNLRGMVAQNSICNGVDDRAPLIPWVLL